MPITRKAYRSWFLSAVVSSLLTVCVSAPESATPANARELSRYTWERSFNAPAGEWPTPDWWASFNDPQLDRLIAEALANAPTIAQADARLQVASYRAQGVESSLWPSISANAAAQDTKLTYNGVIPAQ